MRVPTIVTNDVLFHEPARRILQDVVTCIRHNVTIDELGYRRERHADRYLKPPEEMHRLFARYPEALARTLEIADRCRFSLDELAYQYPEERDDPGAHPAADAGEADLGRRGRALSRGLARQRASRSSITNSLIEKLRYAPYFLTVNSIVRFARSKDILCQGRGSAANQRRLLRARHHLDRSRAATTCCSSASSRRSAASRRTSTSISNMNGARSSCSGSSTSTAAITPPSARP